MMYDHAESISASNRVEHNDRLEQQMAENRQLSNDDNLFVCNRTGVISL